MCGIALKMIWDVLRREFVYLRYYFEVRLRQIVPYWALGIVLGIRNFILYIAYVIVFSLVAGLLVDLII